MFLFGETQSIVRKGKLALPKEFHLKQKQLYYAWRDDNTLCLSDSIGALNYAVGRENMAGTMVVDAKDRIENLEKFESYKARIQGQLSSVEIFFENMGENLDENAIEMN